MEIYEKSFTFRASGFEEYESGRCINSGSCDVTVIAKVLNDECIGFIIDGKNPVQMNNSFGLPIFGAYSGDVLDDRVQYGRLPSSMSWHDSNEPIVCNIFNNMTCIRFAMLSPLRMVEFYGKFTDIRKL